MNRHQWKEKIVRRDPLLQSNAWAWRNWVKNGFRKASAIDYGHSGYCDVQKVTTKHGDIFCLMDRSPIIVRNMRALIVDLYAMSGETPPIFVDPHIFKQIQAVEHG